MMTVDDRRKVIEVLLCGSDWNALPFELHGTRSPFATRIVRKARDHRLRALGYNEYEHACVEAAYRLIEASPRLRREWFGAR